MLCGDVSVPGHWVTLDEPGRQARKERLNLRDGSVLFDVGEILAVSLRLPTLCRPVRARGSGKLDGVLAPCPGVPLADVPLPILNVQVHAVIAQLEGAGLIPISGGRM